MVDENPSQGCCQKTKHVLSLITVEPILFFFFLPYVMLILVNSNLFLEKSCRVNLKLNESICDGLTARNSSMYTKEDEENVQKLVTSMNIWRNIIQSILPIIFLSFMGSWSDKHKHLKPSLIFPVVGGIIKTVGLMISIALFYQLNMEETGLIEVIPSSLLGSTPTIVMGVSTYVSTISTVKERTIRLGFVGFTNFVSYTLGIAMGGVLLKSIGYYGMYSIALSMYIANILYTVFRVKEIKSETQHGKISILGYCRDFLSFKHMFGTVTATFRSREKNHRLRLVIMLILSVLVAGPQQGESNVVYLFTRIRFQWSEMEFSLYYTYHLILNVVGLLVTLFVFSKWLKVDDAILGVIGCSSKVIASLISAFAPNALIFYLAVLVDMYSTISNVAVKSLVTKLIPEDELGKVLSVLCIFEAVPILVYGPLYNVVYNSTISSFPGAFFILGGGLTVPAVLMFCWLYIQNRKDKKEKGDEED